VGVLESKERGEHMKKYEILEKAVKEPLIGNAHFELPDDAKIIGIERNESIDGYTIFYVTEVK